MGEVSKKPVQWVCVPCGRRHGSRSPELPTWHHGRCDACGIAQPVTSARRFGLSEVPRGGDENI